MENPALSMKYDDIGEAIKGLRPVLQDVVEIFRKHSNNGMVRTGNYILLGTLILLLVLNDEEEYIFAKNLLDLLWVVKKIGWKHGEIQ